METWKKEARTAYKQKFYSFMGDGVINEYDRLRRDIDTHTKDFEKKHIGISEFENLEKVQKGSYADLLIASAELETLYQYYKEATDSLGFLEDLDFKPQKMDFRGFLYVYSTKA